MLVRSLLCGSLLCGSSCGGSGLCLGLGLCLRVILVTWTGLRRIAGADAQTGVERIHLTRSWRRAVLCCH